MQTTVRDTAYSVKSYSDLAELRKDTTVAESLVRQIVSSDEFLIKLIAEQEAATGTRLEKP